MGETMVLIASSGNWLTIDREGPQQFALSTIEPLFINLVKEICRDISGPEICSSEKGWQVHMMIAQECGQKRQRKGMTGALPYGGL
jgi:hypothetical protein